MMSYRMCVSPSPVMGGGPFLSQSLVLGGLPSKANAELTNESILVTTLLAATFLVSALQVVDTFFISPQTYKISVNAKGDILLGREASNRLLLTKLGVEDDIIWEKRVDQVS